MILTPPDLAGNNGASEAACAAAGGGHNLRTCFAITEADITANLAVADRSGELGLRRRFPSLAAAWGETKRDDALWRPVPSEGARVGTRRQRTWWPPHPREAGHVAVTDLAMPGPGRPCGDTRRAVAPPWAASGAADGAATGERHFISCTLPGRAA